MNRYGPQRLTYMNAWPIGSNIIRKMKKMDKFQDTNSISKLNQEDINNSNRSIISNEIGAVLRSFPATV